jgi:hypothetical protein
VARPRFALWTLHAFTSIPFRKHGTKVVCTKVTSTATRCRVVAGWGGVALYCFPVLAGTVGSARGKRAILSLALVPGAYPRRGLCVVAAAAGAVSVWTPCHEKRVAVTGRTKCPAFGHSVSRCDLIEVARGSKTMISPSVGQMVRLQGREEIFLVVNVDCKARTVDLARGTLAIEIIQRVPFALCSLCVDWMGTARKRKRVVTSAQRGGRM